MRISVAVFLLVLVSPLVAQTGPGGVGASSTNVLWLSADKNVYNNAGTTLASNGNNVQQWNDRSGNGKNASEANVGNRPNYTTNVVNGLPVIRYTAANVDRLMAPGLTTGNNASVWVVASYSSLPSSNPGLLQGSASGLAFSSNTADKNLGMWVSNGNQPWGRGIQSNGTQLNISQTATLSSGTPFILNSDYGAATIQQYVNNSAAGSVATNGTLSSWTDMAIGVQAGTENWNGDIAEVIAYKSTLNPAQRIIVANYLSAKYGLSLGSNDVYAQDNSGQGNYDFDVAGIGQVTGTSQNQTDSRGSGIIEISNPSDLNNNEFLMWGSDNGALGTWGVGDRPTGIQGRWARVWRVSERNTTNTANVDVGAVDITFDLAGLGPVTASDLRLIVDSDNDGVFANETPISGATHVSGTLYRFSDISALANNTRFTLGTINVSQTPLPIELISFTASPLDATTVRLEWSTASEHDNDYFSVERSADPHTWSTVAMLDAVGNSTSLMHYTTDDREVPGGTSYYRLRQTDIDGASTLSDVVTVDLSGRPDQEPLIYPNPSQGPFTLYFPQKPVGTVSLTLIDAAGRQVAASQVDPSGTSTIGLDPHGVVPGLYHLRILTGNAMSVSSVEITE